MFIFRKIQRNGATSSPPDNIGNIDGLTNVLTYHNRNVANTREYERVLPNSPDEPCKIFQRRILRLRILIREDS